MKKIIYIFILTLLVCSSCQLKLKPNDDDEQKKLVEVQRYDRLESRYLTTGDFSALQQMNTSYPMETRTLIEDVLSLGEVNEPYINSKFLNFYQDSLLQVIISDSEAEFADMDDVNNEFSEAFGNLKKILPHIIVPMVYAQIGALNQSVVVGDKSIGISLDKYLGTNYLPYLKFYSEQQRQTMTRSYIVPDCLLFYLLSVYPMNNYYSRTQKEKDLHMAKMMWTVNKVLGNYVFHTQYIQLITSYMKKHKNIPVEKLLTMDDYTSFGI